MRYLSLLILVVCLASCGRTPMPEAAYGAQFTTPRQVLASDQLLSTYTEAELLDTVQTTVRGTVHEVCQAKGCWMTLSAGTDQEMMVKFKDYAFFVPKDIAERKVVLDGIAYYQITSVEELRHYAEDAGQSPEAIARITEPKRELRFLARGVQLL